MNGATPELTQKYSRRANLSSNHFRQTSAGELTLSSLGVGTYLGNVDETTDRLVAESIISSVASGGVNVIDTAINYRQQRAERSVGNALTQLKRQGYDRGELFLSTKNGYVPGDGAAGIRPSDLVQSLVAKGVVQPDEVVGGVHSMSPGFLQDQLNRSLVNLRSETVDLLYLHNAAEAQLASVGGEEFTTRLREAFGFLEEMRGQGKIQWYGLATWSCFRVPPSKIKEYLSLEQIVALADEVGGTGHGFRFVQVPINLVMQEVFTKPWQEVGGEAMTFMEAAEHFGIGVFASVPLLQTKLFQGKVPQLPGLRTKAQRLLQFVRSIPSDALLAPLVGHKQPEHVQENLELVFTDPLDKEEFSSL